MKTPSPDLARRLVDVTEMALGSIPPPRLEDIARVIGVSRATLYYYFSGRDDLLTFLLVTHAREGARAVEAATTPGDPPELRLRTMVAVMIDYLARQPGICAGLLGAMGETGRMDEALRANDTWVMKPLRDLLAEGHRAGVFDLDDIEAAANAIMGAVLFAVLGRSSSGGDPTDPRFRHRLADQSVRGVLS